MNILECLAVVIGLLSIGFWLTRVSERYHKSHHLF